MPHVCMGMACVCVCVLIYILSEIRASDCPPYYFFGNNSQISISICKLSSKHIFHLRCLPALYISQKVQKGTYQNMKSKRTLLFFSFSFGGITTHSVTQSKYIVVDLVSFFCVPLTSKFSNDPDSLYVIT